jgi:hypothetical protein
MPGQIQSTQRWSRNMRKSCQGNIAFSSLDFGKQRGTDAKTTYHFIEANFLARHIPRNDSANIILKLLKLRKLFLAR